MSREPYANIWLQREDRTPRVRLVANPHYWNHARGPRLAEVVFRNDLTPAEALERVCDAEGEVDIVTELSPADARRVEQSGHARLVAIDAVRVVVGVIDRDSTRLPLGDVRARRALNLALDRAALIRDVFHGHASPLAALAPSAGALKLDRVLHPFHAPYAHDPDEAAALWGAAGAVPGVPLRIAAPEELEPVARQVAADLARALAVAPEIIVYRGVEAKLEARRRLAEKTVPREWDVLIWNQGAQAADGVALEIYHAFAGALGEWRAGPPIPEFDARLAEMQHTTARVAQANATHGLDALVREEALALFLCAPHALYAVNRHVHFTAYRNTFELAETAVDAEHWSRR